EDASGNLRVETQQGTAEWTNGSFKPVTPTQEEQMRRRQPSRSGWYVEAGVLHKLENGKITHLNTGYYVNGAFEDREGRLWISTREERLLRYENGNLKIFSEAESYRRFPHVQFLEDREGSIWL